MSLRDRLFNVAKAELKDAASKLRKGVDSLLNEDLSTGRRNLDDVDERFERLMEEEAREEARRPSPDHEPADVRRWYANLELPIGASLPEVKAAYRRLMRRYHPDKHQGDEARAKAATELAQRLRDAYDGLTKYLEKSPS